MCLRKLSTHDLSINIGSEIIKPVSCVRDLGFHFDDELSMKQHKNTIARTYLIVYQRTTILNDDDDDEWISLAVTNNTCTALAHLSIFYGFADAEAKVVWECLRYRPTYCFRL